MKQLFRLTEQDLHNIVRDTVLNIIREGYHDTVSDEDDEKDDFFDPDGNPSKVTGKKKKGSRKLPYEMESKEGKRTLKEDAGTGGGATNCAGAMQTGCGNAPTGTNPEAGQYTVPFGKMQRRKIYSPKGDAKGDVTKQESNVDMSPAMARKNGKGGSISIPKNRQ